MRLRGKKRAAFEEARERILRAIPGVEVEPEAPPPEADLALAVGFPYAYRASDVIRAIRAVRPVEKEFGLEIAVLPFVRDRG